MPTYSTVIIPACLACPVPALSVCTSKQKGPGQSPKPSQILSDLVNNIHPKALASFDTGKTGKACFDEKHQATHACTACVQFLRLPGDCYWSCCFPFGFAWPGW
ncbi:hypothetical protein BT63DRAFT_420934 [Microthyrium microscopicum]|uniref:Secreted protein n=1 Tax=Microthyrium microscopicum TaxID=703497 RepID=A0A6A6UMQ4_9PEZI|nr:hypothetical protein BT63DRAFT_420934 [Microthyrium microscopicum]